MLKSVKALSVAAALGMGLLGATAAARADDGLSGDGQYQFTLANTFLAGNYKATGFFDLDGAVASNFIGTTSNPYGDMAEIINSDYSYGNLGQDGIGTHFFIASFFPDGSHGLGARFDGDLYHVGDTYQATNTDGYDFIATLFGPSSGGSSSSSSSSSGGAPSPEVNALLGFFLVAGTVAFVKRRGGDHAEAEAAMA